MVGKQKIILSEGICKALSEAVADCRPDKTFVLMDEVTERLCRPLLDGCEAVDGAAPVVIGATDTNKTLETVTEVWKALQQGGATRRSLLINLGGGMVTDLGGFAASTFKRGINFINIPTTLLAMVDASVGGKTGFNFGGLKNEIGVFNNAACVIIDTDFLKTMDGHNICSGYAEMLKHGLINTREMWAQLVSFDLARPDLTALQQMVADSVAVKERIVLEDPTEKGIRKALNLGHTAGHAFEALSLKRTPILHGYAVAYGLLAELYLSHVKTGFPLDTLRQTAAFITEYYGKPEISCADYPALIELMKHDKKNTGTGINFTLLGDIGDIRINQTATPKEIEEALDFVMNGI